MAFKSGCVPWAFGAGGICVGLIALGWNTPVSKTTQHGVEQAAAPARDTQEKIDGELFSEMKPGVTTRSIVQGLLDEGDLVSSSNVGGIATQGYVIRNSDGSSATLIFQNGVLAMKSENGLH